MDKIIRFFNNNNSFALFCHENPDGDAIGAICALKLALQKKGKDCYCFCESKIPYNLTYLEPILDSDESKIKECDALILVDCNNPHRTGKYEDYFAECNQKIAIIDHHQMEEYPADCKYVDSASPSACDLVQDIIKEYGVEIDGNMAKFLYAGISSDTGCFVHPSTTAKSHSHTAELMTTGFDMANANFELFKRKPKGFLKFLKYYICNTKSYIDDKLFISVIDYKHYNKYKSFCEGCTYDFMQGIDGNEICVRLTEKIVGEYNISFRSNKYINVSLIAKNFDGGGHIRASGGFSKEKKSVIIKKLITYCKEALESSN